MAKKPNNCSKGVDVHLVFFKKETKYCLLQIGAQGQLTSSNPPTPTPIMTLSTKVSNLNFPIFSNLNYNDFRIFRWFEQLSSSKYVPVS